MGSWIYMVIIIPKAPLPHMPPPLPQTRNWKNHGDRLWKHHRDGTNLCLGSWLASFLAFGGLLLAFLSTGWSSPRFVSFGGLWSLFLRL